MTPHDRAGRGSEPEGADDDVRLPQVTLAEIHARTGTTPVTAEEFEQIVGHLPARTND